MSMMPSPPVSAGCLDVVWDFLPPPKKNTNKRLFSLITALFVVASTNPELNQSPVLKARRQRLKIQVFFLLKLITRLWYVVKCTMLFWYPPCLFTLCTFLNWQNSSNTKSCPTEAVLVPVNTFKECFMHFIIKCTLRLRNWVRIYKGR